jgi:hypothetical protein
MKEKEYRSKKGYAAGQAALSLAIFFGLGGLVILRDRAMLVSGLVLMALGLPFAANALLTLVRGAVRFDGEGITVTKALSRAAVKYSDIDCIETVRRSVFFKTKSYRIVTKGRRKIFIDGDLFDSGLHDDLTRVDMEVQ